MDVVVVLPLSEGNRKLRNRAAMLAYEIGVTVDRCHNAKGIDHEVVERCWIRC